LTREAAMSVMIYKKRNWCQHSLLATVCISELWNLLLYIYVDDWWCLDQVRSVLAEPWNGHVRRDACHPGWRCRAGYIHHSHAARHARTYDQLRLIASFQSVITIIIHFGVVV